MVQSPTRGVVAGCPPTPCSPWLLLFDARPRKNHMKNPNAKPPTAQIGNPMSAALQLGKSPPVKAGKKLMSSHINPPQAAPMNIHVFFVSLFGGGGCPSSNWKSDRNGFFLKWRMYGKPQSGKLSAKIANENTFQMHGIGWLQDGHPIPRQFPSPLMPAARRPRCIVSHEGHGTYARSSMGPSQS
jgi:hypothetical protein